MPFVLRLNLIFNACLIGYNFGRGDNSKGNEIYNYCRNKGYIIYIITARGGTSYVINITRRQLHSLGITGYKKVFFRHPMDLMVAKYKKNIRKDIPENIIMSIGDQPGDIGEYGGYGLLVKHPKLTPSFFQSLLTFI